MGRNEDTRFALVPVVVDLISCSGVSQEMEYGGARGAATAE